MNNPYNKHYRQESYFGKPYPGLVEFFENYSNRNVVLDLGCGQGRDALFLGRLGYKVVGVDISDVGIQQLNKAALQEKLQVEGFVADIYSFGITDEYDIVLLDSMFHFYKNDVEKETKVLRRIIEEIKPGGLICNFMQKGNKREKELKRIIKESGVTFEVLLDGYTDYPEYDAEFHMYIIKKLE
ncbi:class I SAM-dependent methyltransferase [Anaerotalea alkaliphila]|uniref:Class I SAM-dependent methyltransferase n=1 Tax=Anaerotalea alkaliphila TaxID=2662126 RepID=A0A7X5HY66_9FIRM|nr:class I SAM-dependent methyltransferase [Anaerotalea alkaliphila]NDL68833.1 class I SAM-dependent methyltransferase [Anaerotalea alkaliphila]